MRTNDSSGLIIVINTVIFQIKRKRNTSGEDWIPYKWLDDNELQELTLPDCERK